MGTSGNVLARLGLQTQPQNQNQGSGSPPEHNGWFRRLFQREEIPPPPPPKPPGADQTFKMGAWDRITIGNRTLEDIANTMYNEDRGLRGGDASRGFASQDQLDKGLLSVGHTLINASRKGRSTTQVAPSTVSERDKQSALYQHYLDLARQALREDYNGIDPVGGRTQFNNRFDNYRGPRRMNGQSENLYQDFGPFENAGSKTNPSARIVIYDDAQPAAGTPAKGGKR
ncbi:MAG TPA: hypothetical protein VG759_00390 [Candidatus Angelobacter sp.]|nr:hypothetical protein [Candidatus Angelobacter sp.]